MRKALLLLAVALAFPGTARAGDVTMVWRDVPLGSRTLQAAPSPIRFNMIGLHWQGPGEVRYRTRAVGGGWSPWRAADDDLGPDGSSGEGRSGGWRDGNLDWAGPSDRVQFRESGRVVRLRAYYLWSAPRRAVARKTALAGSPSIVPRSSWLADEKIVRSKARYAPSVKLAIVHHTATTNAYTPSQAAAIVRGIQTYHVKANRWNDVGYNFLVDRFGNVYEGRGGGIDRNVIGAHSAGFNTGSVGVALIGNHSRVAPTVAAQDALAKLLAWRLDVAHVDPLSRPEVSSLGNGRYRAGKTVPLRAISGHRDTGPSECPGAKGYALLPGLAKRVAAAGLPKLFGGAPEGVLGGELRFVARLTSARPWTVTVANGAGKEIATGSGRSAAIDWTWDSAGAGKGPFTWTIAAGDGVLPATGTIGAAPPPPKPAPAPAPTPPPAASFLSAFTVTPSTIAPGSDWEGTATTVGFTLAKPAFVTVRVTSAGGTQTVLSLLSSNVAAGQHTFLWDVGSLLDGRYKVVVTARPPGGTQTTRAVDLVVVRLVAGLTATPTVFSPNGDGIDDAATLSFTLTQAAAVQIVAQRNGAAVATIYSGQLRAGARTVGWDGSSGGVRVPDGEVVIVVTATNALGSVSLLTTVYLDTAPSVQAEAPLPEPSPAEPAAQSP